jgi:hypothetical protein
MKLVNKVVLRMFLVGAVSIASQLEVLCQYRFGEYQSTYIPNNSIQISRALNARYNENLSVHNTNISMLNVLYDYELLPSEVESYNYYYKICNIISERGDYENLGSSIYDVYYSIEPIYRKYAPPSYSETCFDKMRDIENTATWICGYTFSDSFFSTIHFYRLGSEYFAVVTFNSSTMEGIHLAEGKKYIYCGLLLSDIDQFKYVDPLESSGQKFNRLIRNKRCNCQ